MEEPIGNSSAWQAEL